MATTTTTTVIVTGGNTWQTGLCDLCADNVDGFFLAFFFPGASMARAKSRLDGSDSCQNFMCYSPLRLRIGIREALGIEGSYCGDLCSLMWCPVCAAIQTAGEVRKRTTPATVTTITTTTVQPTPVVMQ